MITFDHLRTAIHLSDFNPIPAQLKMAPLGRQMRPKIDRTPPRRAGVLELVYPETDGALHIILTRRTDNLRGHSGQVSFPGGSHDAEDPSFIATALRETCEELGICDDDIEVLGKLSELYIPPSHFEVFPVVATLPAIPTINPNPHEVAEVFTLELDQLVFGDIKDSELREIQGYQLEIPFYHVQGHKVWGATAAMLSELEHRIRAVVE